MQLVYDLSLPAAGIASMLSTLCLFGWLDRLVNETRKRSYFLRVGFGVLNGAAAMLGLVMYPVYSEGTPTVFLILILDILSVAEHEFFARDRQGVYYLFGSAVFFNHFMIYMLAYSAYHTLPYVLWDVNDVLCQRVTFTASCVGCMALFAIFQTRAFPVEEVKEIIHSREGRLLKIWLPATSWLMFWYSIGLLPWVQDKMTSKALEVGMFVPVFLWALSNLASGYIITLYQTWRIQSRNLAQGKLKEAQKNAQTLKAQADHHSLTGLLNRRAWEREVRRLLASGRGGCLIILDLDHFKAVNDNLGHLAGDCVLKETADMLRRAFRREDLIGHIGGDEFCVFMTDEYEKAIVDQRLEVLISQHRREFTDKTGRNVRISVSAGYAMAPGQGERPRTLEELMEAADSALYWQKEHGRDGFSMYREVM